MGYNFVQFLMDKSVLRDVNDVNRPGDKTVKAYICGDSINGVLNVESITVTG
ncbi:MAG: hypothetical protein K6G11_06420 [Lachnospiraceae bacterium]|nr:hypothetical protein [Lachnospiraceae bacterium]